MSQRCGVGLELALCVVALKAFFWEPDPPSLCMAPQVCANYLIGQARPPAASGYGCSWSTS